MMGTKARIFGPLQQLSLEDLVPTDHFYRHVERTLGLAFVRDLVTSCYAPIGRPSVDPIVFFKLQLAMFLRVFALNVSSWTSLPIVSACGGSWAMTCTKSSLTIPA